MDTKITDSLRFRILEALKTGTIRAIDFPEFSDDTNELEFTSPERAFIGSIYARIKADPKLLDIYSPEIKLDRLFKVRLLKSLAVGYVLQDMPELRQKPVNLSFAMSKNERKLLIEIVERHLNL